VNMAARKEAIIKARSLIERQPVYLDTETTGIGPNDNIVEIAVIDDDGYTLIDTLVKPVGTISTETIRIHGITDEMVRASPRWMEVWDQVEPVLSGRFVGIYNAEFDLRLIQQSHNLNWMQWVPPEGMEVFCIMKLYAQFFGRWNPRRGNYHWQSLGDAGRQCGIHLPSTHRAKDDVLLTRALLHHMAGQEI